MFDKTIYYQQIGWKNTSRTRFSFLGLLCIFNLEGAG